MTVSTTARPGSQFIRSASALMLAGGNRFEAAKIAADRWRDTPDLARALERAASDPTTSTDGSGEGLVLPGTSEFLSLVRPRTIYGRLARLRRVPFDNGLAFATGGAAFGFVGEGAPAPVGSLAWSAASLRALKIAGIAVVTEDLLNLGTPEAESAIRTEIIDGAAAFHDETFLSADAAVAGVAPAGLLSGVTAIASSGDPATDLLALLGEFTSLDGVYVVASEHALVAIGVQVPGALQGGRLFGVVPVAASSAAGTNLIAIHAPSVMFADGSMEISVARQGTVIMDTAPGDVVQATGSAPVHTSLWQNNLAGLRLTRYLNWLARDGAVAAVSGADYNSPA